MMSLETLATALMDVRAYLAREARNEDFRNEAAWEAGSSREEHAAIDALTRLDDILQRIRQRETGALAA